MNRRYLLPIEAGAVVEHEPKTLRVNARRQDLDLRAFIPLSVPALTGADLHTTLCVADAR